MKLKALNILLLLVLLALSSQQDCLKSSSPCRKCNLYCDLSFQDQCGISVSNKSQLVIQQDSDSKLAVTFSFMVQQCFINRLTIQGNSSWKILFSSEFSETLVLGGEINLQSIDSFSSEYISYGIQSNSSVNLFQLSLVKDFKLDGQVFKPENFGQNYQSILIDSSGSNITLANLNRINLGQNSTSPNLVRLYSSSLKIKGDMVNLGGNLVKNSVFYSMGGSSSIQIQGNKIDIGHYDQGYLFQISDSDDLSVLASEQIIFGSQVLYLDGGKAEFRSQDSIVMQRGKNLFYLKNNARLNIISQGNIEIKFNEGYVFKREFQNQMFQSQINIVGQIIDLLPSGISGSFGRCFDIKDTAIINITAIEKFSLQGQGQGQSELNNSQLFISSQMIELSKLYQFMNINNTSINLSAKEQILVQAITSSTSYIFFNQIENSAILLKSGGGIKIDQQNYARSTFVSQGNNNSLSILADENIQVLLPIVKFMFNSYFLSSNSSNRIMIKSNGSISFENDNYQQNYLTIFQLYASNNIEISSKTNIFFRSLNSTLPPLNRTLNQSTPLILNSISTNSFLLQASGTVFVENIVLFGPLFNFENKPSFMGPTLINLNTNNGIVFRNIRASSSLFQIGDIKNYISFITEGTVEFSNIQSSGPLISIGQNNGFSISSKEGISFSDIGGYQNAPITQLFYIAQSNSEVVLSSGSTISFTNISGEKESTDGVPGCQIVNLNARNQSFSMTSPNGITISRPGTQEDYYKFSSTSNLSLQWFFASNNRFVSCLKNCQVCTNGFQCITCRQGTSLSADNTQCLISSVSQNIEGTGIKIEI